MPSAERGSGGLSIVKPVQMQFNLSSNSTPILPVGAARYRMAALWPCFSCGTPPKALRPSHHCSTNNGEIRRVRSSLPPSSLSLCRDLYSLSTHHDHDSPTSSSRPRATSLPTLQGRPRSEQDDVLFLPCSVADLGGPQAMGLDFNTLSPGRIKGLERLVAKRPQALAQSRKQKR